MTRLALAVPFVAVAQTTARLTMTGADQKEDAARDTRARGSRMAEA